MNHILKPFFSETFTKGASIQPAAAGIMANIIHSLREVMATINGILGGYLNLRLSFISKTI